MISQACPKHAHAFPRGEDEPNKTTAGGKSALSPTHVHSSVAAQAGGQAPAGHVPSPPTCSMASALQKSLELRMRRSNMWFWRIFPRSTWAPVLTVFSTHLVLSSCWNF